MRKCVYFMFSWAMVLSAMAESTFSVKSVEASQRYPWNGKVDILVTIQGDVSKMDMVKCKFAATDTASKAALKIDTISQSGSDSTKGDVFTRHFVWDAATDLGFVKIDDIALTVNLVVPIDSNQTLGGVQLWEDGPYWAECNVGASKPEEYGYYFWWGDTVGYTRSGGHWTGGYYYSGVTWMPSTGKSQGDDPFGQSACPTYNRDDATLLSLGYIDANGNLVASHDAATAQCGAPWRMPTATEFRMLKNNCTTTWTTRNGVYGRLVTGKGEYASSSIFLPAAGVGMSSALSYPGNEGEYWTSTSEMCYSQNGAGLISLFSWGIDFMANSNRNFGQSVRPVRTLTKLVAGITTNLKAYIRTGVRVWAAEGEALRYDASWYENGDLVRITDDGVLLATGTAGTYNWQPTTDLLSVHTLKLEVLSGGEVVGTETAQFEPPSVSITVEAGNGGSVSGGGSYYQGSEVVLTAAPSNGYKFVKWEGDVLSAENPITITADVAKSVTAVFKQIVTSNISYEGLRGTSHTNPATYQEETSFAFTPPSGTVPGYTFAGWSPNGISVDMTGNQVVTANWTANNYSIVFHANGGSGEMADQVFVYDEAKALTACVFARDGYNFAGWAAREGTSSTDWVNGEVVSNLTVTADGVVELWAVWNELDPIPDLGENPTAEMITNVFVAAKAKDANLVAKITNETEYVAFREWSGKVRPHGGGDAVGAAGVMAAPNAWVSYALGSETLLETAPTDADLTVETFEPKSGEDGKFDFTVSVEGVEVGGAATTEEQKEAVKENLKQVFGLEGGMTLENGGMSSANVEIEFGAPQDGKVKFTAGPKDTDAKTFFMKVKVK